MGSERSCLYLNSASGAHRDVRTRDHEGRFTECVTDLPSFGLSVMMAVFGRTAEREGQPPVSAVRLLSIPYRFDPPRDLLSFHVQFLPFPLAAPGFAGS